MKKNICLCVALIASMIALSGVIRNSYFGNAPVYKIYQSFITGADNYKRVHLKVIVNVNDYKKNQMFETIRNKYIELNGVPDILYIELFDDQHAFEIE